MNELGILWFNWQLLQSKVPLVLANMYNLELVAESLTQDRNDPMDSVHVGKAVFVKEE